MTYGAKEEREFLERAKERMKDAATAEQRQRIQADVDLTKISLRDDYNVGLLS